MQRSTPAHGLLAYQWYPMSTPPFSMIFSVAVNLLHISPACPNILIRWPSSFAELHPSTDVTGVPNNPESQDVVSRRQSRAYMAKQQSSRG